MQIRSATMPMAPRVITTSSTNGAFTTGGPVWIPKVYNGKDRTFFFVAYEKYRDNTIPRSRIASVPSVAQRAGDFSRTFNNAGQLMPIYDPATGRRSEERRVGKTERSRVR